jgi:hypothetical protein
MSTDSGASALDSLDFSEDEFKQELKDFALRLQTQKPKV